MEQTDEHIVLGDEALALGALRAGLSAAYGYPGTPSTEIMEYLLEHGPAQGVVAQWCANEKTALEEALGTSFAGRRALVTMKHVGLNVAADPFMNGSLVGIKGGLVVAVADDPEMHSSQNEQDSRFFADFARIPCLEPVNQQEAYDMVQAAFELSEEFHVPVMLRLTTRLSHSRAAVQAGAARAQNPSAKAQDRENWMLVPARARVRWQRMLDLQPEFEARSLASPWNLLDLAGFSGTNQAPLGVICTGLGYNYFRENQAELEARGARVPVLRISQYPVPAARVRQLVAACRTVVLLEEGYPLVERLLRGLAEPGATVAPGQAVIKGKMDGVVPPAGELTPENVRPALGLPPLPVRSRPALPERPPQLCQGCPHGDSYNALKEALQDFPRNAVCADIGCYALGVLPPYCVPETIVCMGASISMAKGASEAGYPHAVAVIGDSTFYHSGLTPLVDAVSAGTSLTVLILDNSTVGMTGGQQTILPGGKLPAICEAIGVDKAHIRVLEAHRKHHADNVKVLKEEIGHAGVSVVILVRECLETARRAPKAPKTSQEVAG